MKRALFLVAVLISSAAAFGAEQTHRYVVAMRTQRGAGGARTINGVDLPGRTVEELRNLDAYVADLTEAEAAQLRKDPDVKYVEHEIRFDALGTTATHAPTAELHPLDAQVTPYGISMVHAPDVWTVEKGDGINVVVIDTGVDYTHPELKDAYKGGFNAITKTTDPKDDNEHGTHVSGTIVAADNNLGVVGVAPKANLWAVKVLNASGSGTNTNIASGINWVISKKAEVGGNWIINMSLGQCTDVSVDPEQCSATPSITVRDACQHAADAGILIFAAAGNESTASHAATVAYPAAFSSVTAVAAIDSNQAVAVFSDQGPEIAVSAPGVGVFSTVPVGAGAYSEVKSGSKSDDAFAVVGSAKGTLAGKYVYCGLGATAGDFPASVKGNIALIQRGTATFNVKTKNALAAGATAVVIYNCSITATPSTCTNTSLGWTLIGKLADNVTDNPADLNFGWPVTVGISYDDGEALRKAATDSSITVTNIVDDYDTLSGTSMACPHAVGVAALVWGADPAASATDVKNAMYNTSHDLGTTGRDSVFGFGLLDAFSAAKALAPSKFGSPVTPATTVPGRRIIRRGH